MALKRMVLELGVGTDLRGEDWTRAAVRAVRDALWHNALTIAPALGLPLEAMRIEVRIGAGRPDEVDRDEVAAVLPYGSVTVDAVEGGMAIPGEDGSATILANAAVVVFLDLPEEVA